MNLTLRLLVAEAELIEVKVEAAEAPENDQQSSSDLQYEMFCLDGCEAPGPHHKHGSISPHAGTPQLLVGTGSVCCCLLHANHCVAPVFT